MMNRRDLNPSIVREKKIQRALCSVEVIEEVGSECGERKRNGNREGRGKKKIPS